MSMGEGYIKFDCRREDADCGISDSLLSEINRCRLWLKSSGWLGVENGIGFGNLSYRDAYSQGFFISGSATGGKDVLEQDDIARVGGWDFASQIINCRGRCDASSESLTHAAIYESAPEVMVVIHFHDYRLWRSSVDTVFSTSEQAEYGTAMMAEAVKSAVLNLGGPCLIRMGGHQGGMLAWGRSFDELKGILP